MIDTSFSGSVIGESAMNSTSDVGSPLEFVFHVSVASSFFRQTPKRVFLMGGYPAQISSAGCSSNSKIFLQI